MGQSFSDKRSYGAGPNPRLGPNQNGRPENGYKVQKRTARHRSNTANSGYDYVVGSPAVVADPDSPADPSGTFTSRGLGNNGSFGASQGDLGESTSRGLGHDESFADDGSDDAHTHTSVGRQEKKINKARRAYLNQQRLDQQIQQAIAEIPTITLIATAPAASPQRKGPGPAAPSLAGGVAPNNPQQPRPALNGAGVPPPNVPHTQGPGSSLTQTGADRIRQALKRQQEQQHGAENTPEAQHLQLLAKQVQQQQAIINLLQKQTTGEGSAGAAPPTAGGGDHFQVDQQQPQMHIPQQRKPGSTSVERFRHEHPGAGTAAAGGPNSAGVPFSMSNHEHVRFQRLTEPAAILTAQTLLNEEATDRAWYVQRHSKQLNELFTEYHRQTEELKIEEDFLEMKKKQRLHNNPLPKQRQDSSGSTMLNSGDASSIPARSPRRAPPPPPAPTARPGSSPNRNDGGDSLNNSTGYVRAPLRRPLDPVHPDHLTNTSALRAREQGGLSPGSRIHTGHVDKAASRASSPSSAPGTTLTKEVKRDDWETYQQEKRRKADREEQERRTESERNRRKNKADEEDLNQSAWDRQTKRFREEQRHGIENQEHSKRQSILHRESIEHAEIIAKCSAKAVDYGTNITKRISEQKKLMEESKERYRFAAESPSSIGSGGGSVSKASKPSRAAPAAPPGTSAGAGSIAALPTSRYAAGSASKPHRSAPPPPPGGGADRSANTSAATYSWGDHSFSKSYSQSNQGYHSSSYHEADSRTTYHAEGIATRHIAADQRSRRT